MSFYGQPDLVDPFNLTIEHLQPETIAHSLAQKNRYTGHALFPYSVAQHTCLLIKAVPPHLKRTALIHDFPEFVINDMCYPLKKNMPEYLALESVIEKQVFDLLDEPLEKMEELKPYDRRICRDEMPVLFPHFQPEWLELEPLGVEITEWHWLTAKFTLMAYMGKYL